MNDIERLRQLMNEYKQTTTTLFSMLDDYLESTSQKPTQSILRDKEDNIPQK